MYDPKNQPGLFSRCSKFLVKFKPRSYKIVLIKKNLEFGKIIFLWKKEWNGAGSSVWWCIVEAGLCTWKKKNQTSPSALKKMNMVLY